MHPTLFDIHAIVLVAGGILALSALIVAQKPEAKKWIDKLVPFQTVIGVALIALGLIDGLRMLPELAGLFKGNMVLAAVQLIMCIVAILLGGMFGVGQITKWMGNSPAAQQKAFELAQKIMPYQMLLGLVGVGSAVIYALYRTHLMTMN